MKMSLSQMIVLICILAVGFVSVVSVFLQDAYAGVWEYYKESYAVYSFATGEFLRWDDEYEEVVHDDHYTYYHYPGNSTTEWEHYKAYPEGHNTSIDRYVLGKKWE